MNTEGRIEISGANLVEVAKAAYDLSSPQGLGFIHYEDGGLTDEEASELVSQDAGIPLSLDYVKGRACKLTVFADDDGRMYIQSRWYDHSEQDLELLLERIAA